VVTTGIEQVRTSNISLSAGSLPLLWVPISGQERREPSCYSMTTCRNVRVSDAIRSDNTATFKADSCFDLTDNPESTGVTGEDVLAFVTGTNRQPALGFKDTP